MNLIDALSKLAALNQPVIKTHDVSKILDIKLNHASKILRRLCDANQLMSLGRGKWGFPDQIDRFALPEYITSPFPSYISLQSALYHHGMISQIPSVIYAVSLARTKRIAVQTDVISIHHISPSLFLGFEVVGMSQIKIATAEKALFDFFYLSRGRSRYFYALPELELPDDFNVELINEFLQKISSEKILKYVRKKFYEVGVDV